MRFGGFAASAALVVLSLAAGQAAAQAARTGPAELPPASFTGNQYVDSRGCVFVRVSVGGADRWVPRLNDARAPLCGQTPTFAAARAAEPRAPSGPAPGRVGPPMETIASALRPAAPAAAPAAPAAPPPPPAPAAGPAEGQMRARIIAGAPSCPEVTATTPRLRVADGRWAVSCGMGADGLLRIILAPPPGVAPAPAPAQRVAAPAAAPAPAPAAGPGHPPLSAIPMPYIPTPGEVGFGPLPGMSGPVDGAGGAGSGAGAGAGAARAALPATVPPIPEGYKPAWADDRLNPYRAQGTAAGAAAMARIWTQTVPQRLLDEGRPAPAAAAAAPRPAQTSTRGTPAGDGAGGAPAAGAGRWIQVGAFAVAANAAGATARIEALGLPARLAEGRSGGRSLALVLAGPFEDADSLSAALAALRRAGFLDAFARD